MSTVPVPLGLRRVRLARPSVAHVLVGASVLLAGVGAGLAVVVAASGAPAEGHRGLVNTLLHVAALLPLLVLAGMVLRHLPRHPVGWVLGAYGFGASLAAAAQGYATASHFVEPLPGGTWAGWVGEWSSSPIVLLPAVALLLFPDGVPDGRHGRAWVRCGVVAWLLVALNGALGPGENLAFQGNPFLDDETARLVGEPFGLGWFLMIPATVAGIASLRRRRREATGVEEEQLRLVGGAAIVVGLAFFACLLGSLIAPTAFDVGASAAVLSLDVLAAAMAVAILRHRLLGLDVHVDRALVLSATAVTLGALYVGAVLGLGALVGQDVPLGVALPATVLVALAVQPLRERLQRSVGRLLHGHRDEPYAAVTLLGARLTETPSPADVLPVLAGTIAEALRLPFVAVELGDVTGAPAAAHGRPTAGIALRLPLVHAGERLGTLVVGARSHGECLGPADRRLLGTLAERAGAAAASVALAAEVQRSRERLVTAREEERRRLRGDLHDGLGPTLAGAVLTIDAARRVLATDPRAAEALLDRAAANVEGTVAEVRRVVYALRPPALDQFGLVEALRLHAGTLSDAVPPVRCRVVAPLPMPALPAAVEVAAFTIALEALTNVARHAAATAATVTLEIGDALRLEVVDDGRGPPAPLRAGVGLTSMQERATELGGSFEVLAAPSGGTRVAVVLPLGEC